MEPNHETYIRNPAVRAVFLPVAGRLLFYDAGRAAGMTALTLKRAVFETDLVPGKMPEQ